MEEEKWVVRFLNLPSQEQIDFLFRFCLDEALKETIERKVLHSRDENP